VPEYEPGADDRPDPDAEFAISYRAVTTGLPVVTSSGEQFGVVEHVLEVPELDLFDGIVVYTGTGLGSIHPGAGPRAEASARARMLRLGQMRDWLRFVDADQVAVITPGYVKCTFDSSQVPLLPLPGAAPVYHVDMEREEKAAWHGRYGRMFSRPHWNRS
jgi:hypothetical protein